MQTAAGWVMLWPQVTTVGHPERAAGELDHFRGMLTAYMEKKGLRSTDQRKLIVETFFRAANHVSIEELLAQVRQQDRRVGYATVYRTLKLLTECGVANERRFGDGLTRYELADDVTHHDHLICVDCGKIIEFEEPRIEELQDRVARRYEVRAAVAQARALRHVPAVPDPAPDRQLDVERPRVGHHAPDGDVARGHGDVDEELEVERDRHGRRGRREPRERSVVVAAAVADAMAGRVDGERGDDDDVERPGPGLPGAPGRLAEAEALLGHEGPGRRGSGKVISRVSGATTG